MKCAHLNVCVLISMCINKCAHYKMLVYSKCAQYEVSVLWNMHTSKCAYFELCFDACTPLSVCTLKCEYFKVCVFSKWFFVKMEIKLLVSVGGVIVLTFTIFSFILVSRDKLPHLLSCVTCSGVKCWQSEPMDSKKNKSFTRGLCTGVKWLCAKAAVLSRFPITGIRPTLHHGTSLRHFSELQE